MRLELVIIELTNNCNLRCKHCYGFFEKQIVFPLDKYKQIIHDLYDLGCTRLILSGGEPLLLGEKIGDYIVIARQIGIPFIAITTNGTLDTIKDKEIYDKVNLVQVSIDGDEAIHDEIRGTGNFRKSIDFIKENHKYCNHINIMMAVHQENFSTFDYVYNVAQSLNVSFSCEVATECGRGSRIKALNGKQLKELEKKLLAKNISCSDPIAFCNNKDYKFYNKNLIGGCSAGVSAIAIDSSLNVFPCVRLRVNLGNLNNENITEVWENNETLKTLRNRELLKGNCSTCKYLFSCGGCRARAYAFTSNYLEGDDYCVDFCPKKDYRVK